MNDKWNPFDTAPKDGRKILAYEKWNDVPFILYWNDIHNYWCVDRSNFDTDGNAYVIDTVNRSNIIGWLDFPPIARW